MHEKSRITSGAVEAIVGLCDFKIFTLMTFHHGHYIQVTDRVIESAAGNRLDFGIVQSLIRECGKLGF